ARTASQADALEREHAALVLRPERAVAADPAGRDDAVARDDDGEAVLRAEGAGRPRRARPPRERGQLAVGDELSARHRAQRLAERAREARVPVEVELDILELDLLAGEERREPRRELVLRGAGGRLARPGRLVPEQQAVLEHDRPRSEARRLVP